MIKPAIIAVAALAMFGSAAQASNVDPVDAIVNDILANPNRPAPPKPVVKAAGMIEVCQFVQGEIKRRLATPATAKFEDCSLSTGAYIAGMRLVETAVDGQKWGAVVDLMDREWKLISLLRR